MSDTIKQEILLQTDDESFDTAARMKALEEAVKYNTSQMSGLYRDSVTKTQLDLFKADTLTLAKRFEAYIKTGE